MAARFETRSVRRQSSRFAHWSFVFRLLVTQIIDAQLRATSQTINVHQKGVSRCGTAFANAGQWKVRGRKHLALQADSPRGSPQECGAPPALHIEERCS